MKVLPSFTDLWTSPVLACTRNGQGELSPSPGFTLAARVSAMATAASRYLRFPGHLIQPYQFRGETGSLIGLQESLAGPHVAVVNARMQRQCCRGREACPTGRS